MKENKINSRTLRQEVVQILRRKILRGEILPGERIIESDIASELGISRGPVREAVRQLEQEGLVTYNLNRGCSVTTLDPDDAWEIYLLRAHLESLAIRLCNGKIKETSLRKMRKAINTMEKIASQGDLTALIEQDHLFHSEICKSPRKKRLYQLWSSLNYTSFAIFLTVFNANVTKLEKQAEAHLRILQAFERKDANLACEMIHNHYLSTGRKLFEAQLNKSQLINYDDK